MMCFGQNLYFAMEERLPWVHCVPSLVSFGFCESYYTRLCDCVLVTTSIVRRQEHFCDL